MLNRPLISYERIRNDEYYCMLNDDIIEGMSMTIAGNIGNNNTQFISSISNDKTIVHECLLEYC